MRESRCMSLLPRTTLHSDSEQLRRRKKKNEMDVVKKEDWKFREDKIREHHKTATMKIQVWNWLHNI
jgi:hypothetical protein